MVTNPCAARCPVLAVVQDFTLVVKIHFPHDVQGFCTAFFTIVYGNHTVRRPVLRLTDNSLERRA